MNNRTSLKLLVAVFIFTIPTALFAQDLRPSLDRIAKLSLSTGTSVDIFRSAQGGAEERKNVYFHKPAFLFLEKEDGPISGWPEIVQEIEEQDDGGIAVVFNVVSSTSAMRQLAKDQVLLPTPDGDGAWIDNNKVDPSTVTVWDWPVTSVRLSIADRDSPSFFLAAIEHKLTDDEKDDGIWRLRMVIAQENRNAFQALLEEGEANFAFDYIYTGVTESSGKATREYLIEAFNVADSLMNNEQKSGNAPLFQDEKAEVVSQIRENTTSVMSANNIQIFDHLSIEWENTLFQKATVLSELENTPELLASVDSYLQRLVDTIKIENEEKWGTTETIEDNTTFKMKAKGGWGDGWEASGEVDLTREWKSKLENEHGITFKTTTNENLIVASDIEISYLKTTWRQGVQRATTYAFISSPKESGYEFAGIVGQDRGIGIDEAGLLETRQGPFVPVGSAMCYLGAGEQPPEGFSFIHEQNIWPDSALFGSVRGSQMPSADNLMFGSTQDSEKVGLVENGSIVVPGSTLSLDHTEKPAGKITLNGRQRLLSPDGNEGNWRTPTGPSNNLWISEQEASVNVNLANRRKNTLKSAKGADGRAKFYLPYQITPNAQLFTSNYALKLQGITHFAVSQAEATINVPGHDIELDADTKFPRHMKCRWIVRVR